MKGSLLTIFLFSFFWVQAQPAMQFVNRVHDFGSIREVNGAVSYNFEFVNTGNAPVLIKKVESSCGCTSPEWTRQPILPGKKGFIKAIFDPDNRPGYFDKTITVHSNAHNPVAELKIRGTVEGKTRTVLDEYPYELASGLRLPLEHISLMKARKGESKTMKIGVYNNAGKEVSVGFAGLPPYIKLSIEPQKIANQGKATILATYHTGMHGEYGLNREEVMLLVDGKKYPLPVSVSIEEDLSQVALAIAPAVEADKKYYNFGTTPAAAPVSYTYQLKNTGKSPLKIHRVYTNDNRVTAAMAKQILQPGEAAALTLKTNAGAEPGKVACLVSVICNSPASPEFNVRFYGEIK